LKTSLTEFANKVRDAADIVDIIGSFVPLKRSGAGFKGLCPFHKEKTPSFHVHPGKQIFHCFGCGVGGDVIKFIMMFDRVNYRNALEQLAHRLDLPIPQLSFQPREDALEKQKRDIFAVNDFTRSFYQKHLMSKEAEKAREYLRNRGLSGEIIKKFKIGFAPKGWENLLAAARKKGYSSTLLQEAGLVIPGKRKGEFYDRFRERIIFPIINLQGQCVGFGGRAMGDEQPKYINSPESKVYKKGKLLYGMNMAKGDLRGQIPALVVEGYMDLIALHKYGFSNGVATLGTALTDDQARLIKRFTKEAIFIYDGDEAGQNAMLRGCEVFLGQSLAVKLVILPNPEDPDTFLTKHGPDKFAALLDSKKDFIDYFLEIGRNKYDFSTPEGKIGLLDLLKPILSKVSQPILFDDYTRRLAETLNLDQKLVKRHIRARTFRSKRSLAQNIEQQSAGSVPIIEKSLLKLIIENPGLRDQAQEQLNTDWLSSPQVNKLTQEILKLQQEGSLAREFDYSVLIEEIDEKEAVFIRELAFFEFDLDNDPAFLEYLLKRLRLNYEARIRHNLVLEARNLQIKGLKESDDIHQLTDKIHNKTIDIWETRKKLFNKEG